MDNNKKLLKKYSFHFSEYENDNNVYVSAAMEPENIYLEEDTENPSSAYMLWMMVHKFITEVQMQGAANRGPLN